MTRASAPTAVFPVQRTILRELVPTAAQVPVVGYLSAQSWTNAAALLDTVASNTFAIGTRYNGAC